MKKVASSPASRVGGSGNFPDEVRGEPMARIKIGRPAVKARIECIKVPDTGFCCGGANSAHTPIVDGMAPGVVATKFQAQPRYAPAVHAQLKGVVGRMPAVTTRKDIVQALIQTRAVGVIKPDGGDSIGSNSRGNAAGIQQAVTAKTVEIVSGVKPAAA